MSQIEERLLKLEASVKPQDPDKLWHEKISIRGYIQMRYNRLFENNEDLKCEQCDKSMGAGGGFYLRRARLVISGDVHDRVYLYMQADFANDVSATAQHFAQLRDLYADVALDPLKDYRIRMGLSKVIYGFENLQSSQNRLSLDRNDALNSAVAGERDLGVYFFWAPEEVRKRFAALVASGLKGSGDYGVVGVGAYNGQTANKPEANDSQHVAVRLAYPFRTDEGQYIEVGAQGYTGRAVVTSAQRTAGVGGPFEFQDRRVAASLVIYPQPLGFQSEYTWGEGPEFSAPTNTIEKKHLEGGYAQTMYMLRTHGHIITPYVRGQYYRGGKKHETDARRYLVREAEAGIEWQPYKNLELTVAYALADRAYEDRTTRGTREKGGRMRAQAQINF